MAKKTPIKMDDEMKAKVKDRVEKMLRSCTGENSVKVSFGKAWAYDIKNNVLEMPLYGPCGLDSIDKDQFIANSMHEIGHAKYTEEFSTNFEDKKTEKTFKDLLNTLEDIRIEANIQSYYVGVIDNFSKAWQKERNLYTEENLKDIPVHYQVLINAYRAYKGDFPIWSESEKLTQAEEVLNLIEKNLDEIKYSDTTNTLKDWTLKEIFEKATEK
jgi:hypothetical protein